MVPVPKKRRQGACVTDNFRGVSLLSVVYRAICIIIQERLMHFCARQKLIAEEQGGFRRLQRPGAFSVLTGTSEDGIQ